MDNHFRKYRRTNIAEMRDYVKGEDLTGISVSDVDDPETDMGKIARNPEKHDDQWYVERLYVGENFEPIQKETVDSWVRHPPLDEFEHYLCYSNLNGESDRIKELMFGSYKAGRRI